MRNGGNLLLFVQSIVRPIEYKDTDDVRLLKEQLGESQRFLGILLDLTAFATEVEDPHEFLNDSLNLICGGMGRHLGISWLVDTAGGDLKFGGFADLSKIETEGFIQASRASRFAAGEGLPGRALQSGSALWISNLSEDKNFPRMQAAARAGLKAAFAIAVEANGKPVAVMEFFSRHLEPFDDNAVKFLNRLGQYLGIVFERKWADRVVRSNESKYRSIIDKAHHTFIAMNADGIIVDWNLQAEKTFGWSPAEAIGRRLSEVVVPPAYREAHEKGLARFLETGQGRIIHRTINIEGLHRDGTVFPVQLAVFPVDIDGSFVFGAFIIDRREAVRTEKVIDTYRAELQSREKILNAIIDNMAEAVFFVDGNGKVLLTNAAGLELAGGSVQNLPDDIRDLNICYRMDGKTPFPPDSLPVALALKGEPAYDVEMCVKAPTSPAFWLSVNARPLRNANGDVIGAIVVARDITPSRRLQEQLQTVAEEAMASSRLKTEFVANVSHEIRTPLAGILGMSELLATREESDQESREIAGYVLQSAQNLLEIVNDLLDFSKLEAGKITIHKDWFSIKDTLDEVATSVSLAANKKSLQLNVEYDDRIPPQVFGDHGRLTQVLLNFAHNAVKFTEKGSISISAHMQTESPDTVRVKFAVADTGIGIKPNIQKGLFEPFVQADGSTTRRYGGTGLGLSIAKKLTQLMAGEIGLQSAVGKGSTFWVSLPFEFRPSGLDLIK